MNERIKELAKESGIELFEDKSFGWSVMAGTDNHLSKFAELIVRECGQVSLDNSHRDDDMGAIIARNIKQHFGVR